MTISDAAIEAAARLLWDRMRAVVQDEVTVLALDDPAFDPAEREAALTWAVDTVRAAAPLLTAERERIEELEARIEHLLAAIRHECSEIGNAMGGYDCVCGDPWVESFGGCLNAPAGERAARKANWQAAIARHQAAIARTPAETGGES